MTFPLIRPEDVAQMPESMRLDLLVELARENRAAGVRHRTILAVRAARRRAEDAGEVAALAALRTGLPFTEADRLAGEAVLIQRRLLVQQGQWHGDGTLADDLRAAAAAVRAGSTNPYLLALTRERNRLAKAASRRNQLRSRARQRIAAERRAS